MGDGTDRIAALIDDSRDGRLGAYERVPDDLSEHHGIEETVLAGGYGYRQVLELIQNAADAILEASVDERSEASEHRIEVVLDGDWLYAANTGEPFSPDGVRALLSSHSSRKRDIQIGRFGQGFKSLLRLGGRIDVVSNTAAFGFDPVRCRRELQERFRVDRAPALRLAWNLESRCVARLRERFEWATTVVAAQVVGDDIRSGLNQELEGLAAEFLLFLPVGHLTLLLQPDDGGRREITRVREGADHLLIDGDKTDRWRVHERMIRVTDQAALDDATSLHGRDEVPVCWAVPIEAGREGAGRFWAVFPTQTATRLPGILNAPWKLNSDRSAVIPGEWNRVLMLAAADLVVESLPAWTCGDDPGRILDAFPRQLERADEPAAPLIEAVWRRLAEERVVPAATGELAAGAHLQRPPEEVELREPAQHWQRLAAPSELQKVVHDSCLTRDRSSRLDELAKRLPGEAALVPMTVVEWFQMVAHPGTDRSRELLRLADAVDGKTKGCGWRSAKPQLRIIASADGSLVCASEAVFAPAEAPLPDGRHAVAPELAADDEARRILQDVLEVRDLDSQQWVDAIAAKHPQRWAQPKAWLAFWELLRSAPREAAREAVRRLGDPIRVKRRDGQWEPATEVLLPGRLIAADDQEGNAGLLVCESTHGADGELLRDLGLSDALDGVVACSGGEAPGGWLDHQRTLYRQNVDNRASRLYLEPEDCSMPRGWPLLAQLKGRAAAEVSRQFATLVDTDHCPPTVRFKHHTEPKYHKVDVPHPLPWLLMRHGQMLVGSHTVRLAAILDCSDELLSQLPAGDWVRPLRVRLIGAEPPVEISDQDRDHLWTALTAYLAAPEAVAQDQLQALWEEAATHGWVPPALATPGGPQPLDRICVTTSADLARRAWQRGVPAVSVGAPTEQLWLQNGARRLADLLQPRWEDDEPVCRLLEVLPELSAVISDEMADTALCQVVSGLQLAIDGHVDPEPCLYQDDRLLVDLGHLEKLPRAQRSRCLVQTLAGARWLSGSEDQALRHLGDEQVERLRTEVAAAPTLEEKLLCAAGGRSEPLLDALGELGQRADLARCTPVELARLVLNHHGPATLQAMRSALDEAGLRPPDRWGRSAVGFVTGLGFPAVFAASASSRREPDEWISGPIDLPPLHDYQEDVYAGIEDLLAASGCARAVVSLPTGGGKTRVVVEAAVKLVLAPEGQRRRVLWIAQTDELCEQAVEAFRQVWVNHGAQRTKLRVYRLWGGQPNPVFVEPQQPVVVVASIQTVDRRAESLAEDLLSEVGLLVVDECHHAITASYSRLLHRIDNHSDFADGPPVIGLSATPFRVDEDESRRLASRFDNCWLPADQVGLYARLRGQRVLAEAVYEPLQSETSVPAEHLTRLAELLDQPEGFELRQLLETINRHLADDEDRNELLLAQLRAAPEQSILFFANSVGHAEEIALRLNCAGTPAAAVSGETPGPSRRYFLERFAQQEIRVLCNHTVLSTGFDSPKTDLVLIARQVFSPVRYMQMVGRGLRGEKNGGTARCRIVTVLDNLGRFADRHPYHYCQHYFADPLAPGQRR
ncbi:MAG: DEAD/DEAH box helicase [Fimbriimonadaceae bacterium]|nr:DEAD/DEAH box helicase [Fimbriimonadaceae bacterium]